MQVISVTTYDWFLLLDSFLCSSAPFALTPSLLLSAPGCYQPRSPPCAVDYTEFPSQELCVNTGVLLKKLWYQACFEFQISTTSSPFSSLRCSSQVAQPVLGCRLSALALPFPVLGFPTLTQLTLRLACVLLCGARVMSP